MNKRIISFFLLLIGPLYCQKPEALEQTTISKVSLSFDVLKKYPKPIFSSIAGLSLFVLCGPVPTAAVFGAIAAYKGYQYFSLKYVNQAKKDCRTITEAATQEIQKTGTVKSSTVVSYLDEHMGLKRSLEAKIEETKQSTPINTKLLESLYKEYFDCCKKIEITLGRQLKKADKSTDEYVRLYCEYLQHFNFIINDISLIKDAQGRSIVSTLNHDLQSYIDDKEDVYAKARKAFLTFSKSRLIAFFAQYPSYISIFIAVYKEKSIEDVWAKVIFPVGAARDEVLVPQAVQGYVPPRQYTGLCSRVDQETGKREYFVDAVEEQ